MTGEFSPDIMFWEGSQKMVRMGANGCESVRIGHYNCISNGGTKNKTKTPLNARAGHVCLMCDHGKKSREVGRDSLGGQRGSWGAIEGNQEACGTI